MPTYDANTAECLVFTYKEGLLSPIAHDLKIRVTGFTIEADEQSHAIDARFTASSLRVVCAMRNGAEDHRALSEADKRKIEQNISEEVLLAAQNPEIRFVSTSVKPEGDGFRVEGNLTLRQKTRPLSFTTRKEGDRQVAEVKLHQPDFGIKPYTAMLGTLKVKPDVMVRVSLPVG